MAEHVPASDEAIAGAAEVFGAILADPERAEQIRADLDRRAAEQVAS